MTADIHHICYFLRFPEITNKIYISIRQKRESISYKSIDTLLSYDQEPTPSQPRRCRRRQKPSSLYANPQTYIVVIDLKRLRDFLRPIEISAAELKFRTPIAKQQL